MSESLKVSGVVDEISRKPKSWKLVMGKKNYYSKTDVSEFVGKNVEIVYHESEPYDYQGKSITSKMIDTIKVIGSAEVLESIKQAIKTSTKADVKPETRVNVEEKKTDWDSKERRELKKTIWDTCFMSLSKIYPDMSINDLCDLVDIAANRGYSFVYNTILLAEAESHDLREQESQLKSENKEPETKALDNDIPF